MKRDVHQARHRAERCDGGNSGHRLWLERAVTHHTQASLPLGNQNHAVGKERDAPGVRQSLRHYDRTKAALLVAVEWKRTITERWAIPRSDAWASGNGAALIANGRIWVLPGLGARRLLSDDDKSCSDRAHTRRKRGDVPHLKLLTSCAVNYSAL